MHKMEWLMWFSKLNPLVPSAAYLIQFTTQCWSNGIQPSDFWDLWSWLQLGFFRCLVLPQDWMLLFFYKCKFYHYRSIFRFQNQRNHETNSIFCMKLSTKIKFIVSPHPLNPKSSQNPKYHIWLESLNNVWKNVHLRILNFWLSLTEL